MSDVILKIENLSKQYRLGTVGTGTVSHDLNRWWHAIRGKEDPYLKIGASNDRSAGASSNYVWALRDINLEVKQGEILGIIGKNGAGKSTLLKILSRVTQPTEGSIKSRGRIASLLEVGTGFHPELTGRENIYLNGAILGMTKAEIKAKEEEIVEFSGCRMYIDTPVKRYSSGMRVRLGFAVAAFLEPDILVVDEVLAVGDAEFQKKAIGKMQDISQGEGRTVLFVSHNMASVEDLCQSAIVMEQGMVKFHGEVSEAIKNYLQAKSISEGFVEFEAKPNFKSRIKRFEITNSKGEIVSRFKSGERMYFRITINVSTVVRNPIFSLRISDAKNINILCWRSNDLVEEPLPRSIESDFVLTIESTESLFLMDSVYSLSMSFLDGKELLDFHSDFINFEVVPGSPGSDYFSITKQKTYNSVMFSPANWNYKQD